MGVPGASQYRIAAQLANTGQASRPQSGLIEGLSLSLLDIGRGNAVKGIGISRSARAMNRQFLNQSAGAFNNLFSNTIGQTATVEGLQAQIQAIRSRLPASQVREDLRPVTVGSTGRRLDTTA